MAPPITPDPTKYDLTGDVAKIFPSGGDDRDNAQTVLNALAATPGAKWLWGNGVYHFSYQLDAVDADIEMFGLKDASGYGAKLTAGLVDAPMTPLDAADREVFHSPFGWPSLFNFRETVNAVGTPIGTPVNMHIHDMGFQATKAVGHEGIVLGGLTHPNMNCFSFLHFTGPMGYKQDVVLVMNTDGTTPTALGDTNVAQVSLNAALLMQGKKYVEGVDYTVDLVAGTVTRLSGGLATIPSGATVYGGYDNTPNLAADVLRRTVLVEDNDFSAEVVMQNGIAHPNVDDIARVWGSHSYVARTSVYGVFAGGTYKNIPELASLAIDVDTSGSAINKPYNGDIRFRRNTYRNLSGGVSCNHNDGIPTAAGDHVYPGSSLPRGILVFDDNEGFNIGVDNELWFSFHLYQVSNCDVSIRKNKVNTSSALARLLLGVFGGRLGAWDGDGGMSFVIEDNESLDMILGPGDYGPFGFEPLRVDAYGYGVRNGRINNNLMEFAGVTFRTPIMLEGMTTPVPVQKNAVRALIDGGGSGSAISVEDGQGDISDNDVSGWRSTSGAADILIKASASGVLVHADDGDTIDDLGTASVIIGGKVV